MNKSEEKQLQDEIAVESAVSALIEKKIEALGTYSPQNVRMLSYQLSEIMVHSKNLYTGILPELLESDEKNEEEVWKLITGLRMQLLHIRDCVDGFDRNLLNLMEDRDEDDDEVIDDEVIDDDMID